MREGFTNLSKVGFERKQIPLNWETHLQLWLFKLRKLKFLALIELY